MAGRLFDIYKQLQALESQLFLFTATEFVFIARWGLQKGVFIKDAARATGLITVTGTEASIIPEGSILQNTALNQYETINQDNTIADHFYNVSSITRIGTTATVTFLVTHNLAAGMSVDVSGADQTEYNGTFEILVPDQFTITYEIVGTPATPATGTIIVEASFASVDVRSIETGLTQNLDGGAILSFVNTIPGVDIDTFVQVTNVSGGADAETVAAYKKRVQFSYTDPISNFNFSQIIQLILSIAGNTRAWVFTSEPVAGQVDAYVVRDDDPDIIPDATEIQITKDLILTIRCAPLLPENVRVFAPIPIKTTYVFTELVPNSLSMQNAIQGSLIQLHRDKANVSEDLSEDAYRAAIQGTINPDTGETITTFTLSSPIGPVVINKGELATNGGATF